MPGDELLLGPFGDHLEDGLVQVAFSLPLASSVGRRAAKAVAEKMGLRTPEVVHEMRLCSDATYYIIYGRVDAKCDVRRLEKMEPDFLPLTKGEVESRAAQHLRRDIAVIGASTGSDTHSVGIDAILNHKGYGGHAGLEAYRGFAVRNLGSQVPNERLVREAVRMNADAILVSQTVTQQDLHVENLTALVDLLEAEGLRDRFILVCGGPRITQELAKELGYDAGFSKGSFAEHVGSFVLDRLIRREADARTDSDDLRRVATI